MVAAVARTGAGGEAGVHGHFNPLLMLIDIGTVTKATGLVNQVAAVDDVISCTVTRH